MVSAKHVARNIVAALSKGQQLQILRTGTGVIDSLAASNNGSFSCFGAG